MKCAVITLLLGISLSFALARVPPALLKWSDLAELSANQAEELSAVPESRITNGKVADRKQFPYQAGLMLYVGSSSAWCGGTIISKRHILTAAHCTDPVTKGIDVYLGAWNIRDMSDKHMQIVYVPKTAKSVIVHENWDSSQIAYDISIIKLPIDIIFNDYIKPANLPALGSVPDYTGQMTIASGWGKTSDKDTSVTDKLRYIEVPIMARSSCARYFFGLVKDYQICIKTGSDHTSSCNGDSGGPLVLADGSTTVIGLTSFGSALGCELGFPGVYTRTDSFNAWIRKHIA